jgi:hypothetical protein
MVYGFIHIFVLALVSDCMVAASKHDHRMHHAPNDNGWYESQKLRSELACEAMNVKEEALLRIEKHEECRTYKGIREYMKNSSCRYGEASMQKSYSLMEYIFSDIKGMLDIPDYKNLLQDLPLLKYKQVHGSFTTHGSQRCDLLNRTEQYEMNLCPWHYVLTYRFDRYPHFQTQVRCNCKRCPLVDQPRYEDFNFECRPVIKIQPALIRDGCVNNTYVWKPALEEISVACACMRHEPSITLKKIQF